MKTYVIVGLGLIGGSLGGALRKRFSQARVIGVSRRASKIRFAKRKRLIHEGTTSLRQALKHADVVFICTPVQTIPRIISEIDSHAKPKTVVTDVGSTKAEIVAWTDRQRFRNIHFIGCHPLAGSHLTGPEHARTDLFKNATVFLTPTKRTSAFSKRTISFLWKRLGGNIRRLSPKQHDQIASEISHLPHAVVSCLISSISKKSLRFGGSGFLDTTRIAQGDASIWVPIFLSNRGRLLRDLAQFDRSTARLRYLLKTRSGRGLQSLLKQASLRRASVQNR